MAKVFVSQAAGNFPIKAGNGYISNVSVTKAGDAAATVTIYDNPSAASGPILYASSGTYTGSVPMNDGLKSLVGADAGLYMVVAGSTAPTVIVTYE